MRYVGKDYAPLAVRELAQGLLETIRKLRPFGAYRIKLATLFLVAIDEDGDEVMLDPKGEWIIRPYKSAAEEFNL